ncbi:MAG: nuclear transport factor 2 family protein [Spirosomataceae bacterium]
MKTLPVKVAFLTILFMSICSVSFAQKDNTDDPEKVLQLFVTEYNADPHRFFDSRIPTDFRYTNSKGLFSYRESVVKGAEGRKSTTSEVANLKFFKAGDLIVASGIHTFEGYPVAFTYTLQKQNGRWMFAASHHSTVEAAKK